MTGCSHVTNPSLHLPRGVTANSHSCQSMTATDSWCKKACQRWIMLLTQGKLQHSLKSVIRNSQRESGYILSDFRNTLKLIWVVGACRGLWRWCQRCNVSSVPGPEWSQLPLSQRWQRELDKSPCCIVPYLYTRLSIYWRLSLCVTIASVLSHLVIRPQLFLWK